MRPVTVTADIANGETFVSAPVVLDQYLTPTNVTYSKTGSGTVQVTTTDPFPKDPATGNWIEPTFTWISAPTTSPNATGFLGQPYRAIRLSGAAEGDTLTVIQAGVK